MRVALAPFAVATRDNGLEDIERRDIADIARDSFHARGADISSAR